MKNTVGKSFTMVLQVSITMMVPIALCVALSVWLDSIFHAVWLMPVFLVLGIGAAFRNAWILLKGYTKNDDSTEAKANAAIRELKEQGKRQREAGRHDIESDQTDK